MKFSIFFEMQIADPTPRSEAQLLVDCLEQAVRADELGYHGIWEVEHHGLYEYSHSSAPEVFLACVAGRTTRIRLGHGVTLLPFRYNHPIRIAERIATLDVLSNGRVNWGTGKSSSLVEKVAFENDMATLHEQWLEALDMIPRMWSDDVFSYKGRFFDIADIQVVPKPIQRPHPPIFAACTKPITVQETGRLGLGALNFTIGGDDDVVQKVRDYRRESEQATRGDREQTNHFACTVPALVLDSDRHACRDGFRGARFFSGSLAAYYMSGNRPVGRLEVPRDSFSDDDLARAMALRNTPGSSLGTVIGDPVCAREVVQRFVDTGVDELILIMQMGTVPHDTIMESLRTFSEKVMPHFA